MAKKESVKLEIKKIKINSKNINEIKKEDIVFNDLKIIEKMALLDEVVYSSNLINDNYGHFRYNELMVRMVIDVKYIIYSTNIEIIDENIDLSDFYNSQICQDLKESYLIENKNYLEITRCVFKELDKDVDRKNDSLFNIMSDFKNLSNKSQEIIDVVKEILTQENVDSLIGTLNILGDKLDKESLQVIIDKLKMLDRKDVQVLLKAGKSFIN